MWIHTCSHACAHAHTGSKHRCLLPQHRGAPTHNLPITATHCPSVLQCSVLQRLPLTQHNNLSPYSHICMTYEPVRSRSTFDTPQQFEPLAQLLYSKLLRCNLLQCVTASCSMLQCVVLRRLPSCSILCCCPVCYCE